MWTGSDYGYTKPLPPDWATKAWSTRRLEYELAIRMFRGNQMKQLAEDLYDSFSRESAKDLYKQALPLNITRMVVEKLDAYSATPTWECESNSALIDALPDDLHGVAKQADAISELCDLCFVGVEWCEEDQMLCARVIPPDSAQPIWSEYEDGKLEGLSIWRFGSNAQGKTVSIETRWTDKTFAIYRDGADVTDDVLEACGMPPNPGRENPYGVIPFAVMRPRHPVAGDPWGHWKEDLVSANRTVNMKMAELQYLLKMQSHSVPVWIGPSPKADLRMDSGDLVTLEPSGDGSQSDFKYVSPAARITELKDGILDLIDRVAMSYNIASLWGKDTSAAISGVALQVRNAGLERYLKDKQGVHVKFWHEFGEIAATVANAHSVGNGQGEDFSIEFGRTEQFSDRNLGADAWLKEIAAGVRTTEEWALVLHPEMDEAEAEKYIVDNLATIKDRTKAAQPPPASQFMSGMDRRAMTAGEVGMPDKQQMGPDGKMQGAYQLQPGENPVKGMTKGKAGA